MRKITKLTFAIFIGCLLQNHLEILNAQETKNTTSSALVNILDKQTDYNKIQIALGEKLQSLMKNKTSKEMYSSKEFMALATAYDMISMAGSENINQLILSDKKYAKFIPVLLKDTEWMQSYLAAGLIGKNTNVGIRVLGDIWFAEGKSADFRKYMALSSGIAAAWSAGNYAKRLQEGELFDQALKRTDPVWRYKFFKKSHIAGKLHKNFMKLKAWEIRFVAGGIWDDASLAFTQKRINLPPSQYGNACWTANYSGISEFGDTIQGPLYYSPWSRSIGEAERTVKHGGVCGALSHVGSTAAAAHGIPSFPEGQPGHCAYAFRLERGEWLGGFGGPDGGPHNSIFPGEAPSSTALMEAAFASDEKVSATYRYAILARTLDALRQPKTAKNAWDMALAISPYNFNLQKEYQEFLIRNQLFTAEDWQRYAKNIYLLYKGHAFSAQRLVEEPEKQFFNTLNDQEKLAWYTMVNKAVAETRTSWATKLGPVIDKQVKQCNGNKQLEEKLLTLILTTHLQTGDGSNFGQALEWAVTKFVENNKSDIFANAFAKAAASDTGNIDKNKMRDAYKKAILSAEAARSIPAFQVLSEASKEYRKGYTFNQPLDIPKGTLVSDKGMLRLSTTSSWDQPCDHINVLRLENGAFHTEGEEKPYAIVELPETVQLSGILIVKNPGNEQRTKNLTVYRSTDGATWFEVKANDNTPRQWRIDTPDNPSAKWIKVEANPGHKEVMHLRNILIYKK